jgi:hypothetical protein
VEYPLFDTYFKYVQRTEAPMMFHRWSMLSSLGALLGRQYHLPFGEFRIFPNMYVMLIGDPGTRKSTAIKLARKAISAAGYSTFAYERSSKEKFLMDLAGMGESKETTIDSMVMDTLFGPGVGGTVREVFAVADEFNDFAGTGNLDFLSLLGTLWDWDDETKPYEQRFKNSASIQVYQPTVSILGGNTHAGFTACFPPAAIGQGFLSRLLLVYSEPSGVKITFPERPSEDIRSALEECFTRVRNEVVGESSITTEARGMLDTLYRSFKPINDVRFQHYSTRRFTHLLKVCMLCSAARFSTEISRHDVIMANSILSFAEHHMPAAMGEYGKAKNADVSAKIVSVLTDAKGLMRDKELWKHVQQDLESVDQLQKLLQNLIEANKIQWISNSASSQGYAIVRQVLNTSRPYLDYSLLIEAPKLVI